MIKTIITTNALIRYRISGIGTTIVLLHGYLESLDIWDDFSKLLEKNYQVISIDLPGHGKSELYKNEITIENMADSVLEVLKNEFINKVFLVGHSMGGYVALEFLKKHNSHLIGLCLFHSTPYPDNEIKRSARELSIEDIKNGNKLNICKSHVPKTFANENIDKFTMQIGYAKIIAQNTKDKGIIAALEAMKNRCDHSETIEKSKIPVLIIHGLKDNFIPTDIVERIKLPEKSKIFILENSGHQGYIEETDNSIKAITSFIEKL